MRKLNKYGLTPQQETFCQEYFKNPIMYKAYIKAYPKAEKWKRTSIDPEANKMMNNPKIITRIEQLQAEHESVLKNSTTLNKRKLLETAIEMLETTNTPSERGHAVQLLKMLFQKEGLLSENNNNININVNNNTCINEVSNFLDL